MSDMWYRIGTYLLLIIYYYLAYLCVCCLLNYDVHALLLPWYVYYVLNRNYDVTMVTRLLCHLDV